MQLVAIRQKEPLPQKIEVKNAPAQVVQIEKSKPETINLDQTVDQLIVKANTVVLQIDRLEIRPNINLSPNVNLSPRINVQPSIISSVVNVPKSPPPVVNLTMPESLPPVVEVNVPPAPAVVQKEPPKLAVIEYSDGTRSTVELS